MSMPETTETSLTTLADAAFRQAAAKVVRRAQQTETPLIVWEHDRVQAITPGEQVATEPSWSDQPVVGSHPTVR